ncbi:hypothetical protein F3Y22_tig00112353pilonHSYRG00023 [Hibiscus syriacus]|uniref:Protein BREAKING OF ASYMMETRY IN THE STOMATAL LINEAGE n=1 Tax=Hibiscus syriacus TaxID=106335 RepID=A0A6A2X0L4_HIBSY|nr:protein BREAKING OF ASYMMETRY IN THE STOMATAL LINEAGE [Hibiscus syriacus]KAE8667928.1 hypothetical protein F3Y22_tig00112353pilonHSYRG00023 [Hibiscus syriacus]
MYTPSLFTRFVRWRVKDFASCFLACSFPAEEEPAETNPPSSSKHPKGNIVSERNVDSGGKEINERRNECDNGRRRRTLSSKNRVSMDDGSENSSRPCFSDEEYIVFCFKEDGAFLVMEDGNKSEESNTSSWAVNRKVKYNLDFAETDKHTSDQGRSNEAEINAAKDQGEGERSSNWWEEEETPNHRGTVSVESSGSNQSDGSTGSFAFPVLGWEWMGSPVQMPKSQGIINTRKNKAPSLHFHCFRF